VISTLMEELPSLNSTLDSMQFNMKDNTMATASFQDNGKSLLITCAMPSKFLKVTIPTGICETAILNSDIKS
jgi:hypothetical protein